MQRYLLLLALCATLVVQAQRPELKINMDYFFDNREYDGSPYSIAQTLTGTHVLPQIVMKIDSLRTLHVGANLLTLAGDNQLIAKINAVAYYALAFENHKFVVGAFPRINELAHYSELMFRDSVQYFRPIMHGASWTMGNSHNYFNLWLDWTGRANTDTEESFFVGLSAAQQIRNNFQLEFQSYMFHLAYRSPRVAGSYVCDNLQSITNIAYRNTIFGNRAHLVLKAGLMAGAERERTPDKVFYPAYAGLFELQLDSKRFAFASLWHLGDKRMQHYAKYGNTLYWGNPFLRGGNYVKNSLYWHIFKRKFMVADIGLHLHASNQQLFFQQSLKVSY